MIGQLLPRVDSRGQPWPDHRQMVNGVLWRLRTGAPWRDLPERQTVIIYQTRPRDLRRCGQ
ncbi:transposase [Streptomyces parvulus]|uniref:transposase n=1 Tax=Streptomyces parvulus TaxID=146923 RepID=UPI0037D84DD9